MTVSCCYDDFVQDDRSLGFFPRHPELRYVALYGDQIHDLIALPKMPGLESLFSATTLQGLTGSWLFEGLTITRFPRLTPTIPWYLASADIAIYRDTKTVLSLLLRHLPHCRDLQLVNKDECSVVSPVALLAKCCYVSSLSYLVAHLSFLSLQDELWNTIFDNTANLKHLKSLTLFGFPVHDPLPPMHKSMRRARYETVSAIRRLVIPKMEKLAQHCPLFKVFYAGGCPWRVVIQVQRSDVKAADGQGGGEGQAGCQLKEKGPRFHFQVYGDFN